MLFEDKEVALLMREHIALSFHTYELPELFQVYKLLSLNFYGNADVETLKIIEDAVKIRASEPSQRALLKSDHVRNLIEGLRLHVEVNKRLDGSLRTIVKNKPELLEGDKRLFVQYMTYASDTQTAIKDESVKERLRQALQTHLMSLNDQEKSHLKLYGRGTLPQDILDSMEIDLSVLNQDS